LYEQIIGGITMSNAAKEWYVLHTYSGYENKVKSNIELRISSMGMEENIFRVIVPEEEEVEEEVKPRTPMEKLEYNANKAAIKVDFYERVVRSVAREEKELDGYNEVLGKKKPTKVKQQKQAKTAKTKKK